MGNGGYLYSALNSPIKHWNINTLAIINVHDPVVGVIDYVRLAGEHNISHLVIIDTVLEGSASPRQSGVFSSLVSLVIDDACMNRGDVRTLLSLVPNLEHLELGSCYNDDSFMPMVLTLCPKVTHVHLSTFCLLTLPDDDIHPRDYLQQFPVNTTASRPHPPGLRHYSNHISDFGQAEYDMLLRHQSSLEFVSLGQYDPSSFAPDWRAFNKHFLPNTTLKHVVLPLYHKRVDPHFQYDDAYGNWLNACQELEHLEMNSLSHDFGPSMMDTLENHLPSLRYIVITFVGIMGGTRRFANCLQMLRALRYRCDHFDTLKDLTLTLNGHVGVWTTAIILSMVVTIRTLETLTVHAYDNSQYLNESDVLGFIESLQFALPRLKHLSLGSLFTATNKVIRALGSLHQLESLAFTQNEIYMNQAELLINIMGDGLKELRFIDCGLAFDNTNQRTRLQLLAKQHAVNCVIIDYE